MVSVVREGKESCIIRVERAAEKSQYVELRSIEEVQSLSEKLASLYAPEAAQMEFTLQKLRLERIRREERREERAKQAHLTKTPTGGEETGPVPPDVGSGEKKEEAPPTPAST